MATVYILKEIYFTPWNKTKQNQKKKKGLEMWYIGNVWTTVVYIFFWCKLREKNVNTVIIIALHKSRPMPAFPPQQSPLLSSSPVNKFNLTGKKKKSLFKTRRLLHWFSYFTRVPQGNTIYCCDLSAVHSRESHSHNKYFISLIYQVKTGLG